MTIAEILEWQQFKDGCRIIFQELIGKHIPRREKRLPPVRVIQGPPRYWIPLAAVLGTIIVGCTVYLAYVTVADERARLAKAFADLDVAQTKITVAFDGAGIVCTVPRHMERAGPVVNQGCTALAGALKHAGVMVDK